MGLSLINKISQIWITQKCFEILTPNFYQLKYLWESKFSPNLKFLDALVLNFQPKWLKTSEGRGRLIFWGTSSKFGEKAYLLKMYKWCVRMILIFSMVSDLAKMGGSDPSTSNRSPCTTELCFIASNKLLTWVWWVPWNLSILGRVFLNHSIFFN